jgi:glutaredoxin 3
LYIVIHELDKRSDLDFDDAMSYLGKLTGDETVPRVFINKKFIGGGDDTERLHKNGELKKLLEDAQAL